MKLASRFANRSPSLRSSSPLTDDQIRAVAPSIFAVDKHASRSERYTYTNFWRGSCGSSVQTAWCSAT